MFTCRERVNERNWKSYAKIVAFAVKKENGDAITFLHFRQECYKNGAADRLQNRWSAKGEHYVVPKVSFVLLMYTGRVMSYVLFYIAESCINIPVKHRI